MASYEEVFGKGDSDIPATKPKKTSFDEVFGSEEDISHSDKSLRDLVLGTPGEQVDSIWKGVGNTLGITSDKDYHEAYTKAKESAKEHPVQAMLGQAGGVLAPAVAAGIATPILAPLAPAAGLIVGGMTAGAVGAGNEYAAMGPAGEKASPLQRLASTDLAYDVNTIGAMAPMAGGTTLAQRVASGVGINMGIGGENRAVSNEVFADRPDLQQDVFDPKSMGADAVFGAVAGGMHHLAAPHDAHSFAPASGEDARADLGSKDIYQASIDQMEKQKQQTEYKIQQLESRRNDPEYAQSTPERAEMFNQAIDEQIAQHKKTISDLDASIEHGKGLLSGEPEAAPAAPTPREAVGNTINEKLGKLDELEGKLDDLAKKPSLNPDEYNKNRSYLESEIQRINDELQGHYADERDLLAQEKEHQAAQEGVDPTQDHLDQAQQAHEWDQQTIEAPAGLDTEVAPSEHIEIHAPVDDRAVHELDLDTVHDRINEVMAGNRHETELEPLMRQRAALENETKPSIRGGDSAVRKIVEAIADRLGLSKEKLDIDLDAQTEKANWAGDAGVDSEGNGRVRVRPIEEALSDPDFKGWFNSLTKEQNARLKQVWTAAHELGHVMLAKLLQNKLYNGDTLGVDNLLKGFDAWKEKQGNDQVRGEGNLTAKPKNPDYYLDFPEYFAQRVAKEMVMGEHAPKGLIREYIQNMRAALRELISSARLPFFKQNFVDSFIKEIVRANKDLLETTGKTIFEIHSTKGSIHDAWVWQNENLFANKRQASEVAEMPSSTPASVQIEDAHKVIADQMAKDSDINPLGTGTGLKMIGDLIAKGGAMFQGLQQKKGFYFDSPLIQHASNVIRKAIVDQQIRQMQLLSGEVDMKTWMNNGRAWFLKMNKVKDGSSPAVVFDKSTNEDFHAVQKVLEQGSGTHSYEESLAKFGGDLTPQQKVLYKSMTDMYAKLYKMSTELEEKLGKKGIIPKMKGWYPAVRQGDYVVNFHVPGLRRVAGMMDTGEALMTDLVHSQRFRTKEEAQHFIDQFERQSSEFKGKLKHNGIEEVEGKTELPNNMEDFFRAVKERQDVVRGQGGSFEDLDRSMQRMIDQYIARGGTLGGHHKFRTNVTGAKGSEMFKDVGSAGKAFRDAQFDAVHEYTRQMMKMEIGEKMGLVLNEPGLEERFPNTTAIANQMKDHALNDSKSPLEMKGMKKWMDTFWINSLHKPVSKIFPGAKRYQDAHISDIALGKLSHVFYMSVLTMRPSFWVAQASQSAWVLRSLVKDGSGPVSAMASMGAGMKQLFHPDEEFMQGLYYHTQKAQTFSPQFVHDLNKYHILDFLKDGSVGKLVTDVLTGEMQSSAADSLSRIMSYAALHEHYKAKGLKGTELFDKAGEMTDENMVQYGRQYKAPVFQKLGVLGDLVSPLQTFSTAAFGNLAADFRYMLKDPQNVGHIKAALPLISTMMITALMGGAIGIPFGAEYEAVAKGERALVDKLAGFEATGHLINYLSEHLGLNLKFPSLVDIVLSGDNTFSHRVLSHGLVSASTMAVTGGDGMDVGSSLRYQPLFGGIEMGQKSWMDLMPSIKFALQQGGYYKTIWENAAGWEPHSDAELRTALLGITPGYLKGVMADAKGYNDGPMELDTKGHALVPMSDNIRASRYLGTSTIPASVERLRNRQLSDQKVEDTKSEAKLSMRMTDAVQHGDLITARVIGTKIMQTYGRDVKHLNQVAGTELFKRDVSEDQRRFINKSGTMNNQQKWDYKKYMDTYGDSPYEKEDNQ